jgi:eukaryotic-like serine/threonine-protein kinase
LASIAPLVFPSPVVSLIEPSSNQSSAPLASRTDTTLIQRAGPGTVVGGRYALRAAVGTGGMGTVWRASDTHLNRDVAVKEVVPPPGIAPDDRDAMYERMNREARAAASLSHPGIVQVYDVVTDSGRPWVVMELLDARSLSDMVLEDGPLAPRAVAKIGVALLGALEVAHAAGVLHRDVKPANVLVCTDGRCVLTDFGVARMPTDQQLTTPGMVLGSPHFISPERAMGAAFGPPSDLFSLGVTLYAAVEGRPPFDKGEPIATMHAVVEDDPIPPQRAGVLGEVLYGLLEKDPGRRWDAVRARGALRDLLAGPLASRTPMFPTDPYAVVQTQPIAPAAGGGERIGGRALLGPGELPVDRSDLYRAPPDPYARDTDVYQYGHGYGYGPEPDTVVTPVAAGAGAHRVPDVLAAGGSSGQRVRKLADDVLALIRRTPATVQVAVAAGLTTLVLIAVVLAVNSRGDGPDPAATGPGLTDPSVAPVAEPPFAVQTYSGRGIEVNLPEPWQGIDNPDLVYVDYVDPADPSVAVRLLAEPWSGDAQGLVEVAERNIQNNGCDGYERVLLDDIEVADRAGAQLEYTCSDPDQRRARWVTVVEDGTAYSFRLTAPAGEFADREAIFDELMRSFRLTGDG